MRAVIQRVTQARVTVDGEVTGNIAKGLLIFLAVHKTDDERSAAALFNKIIGLRIFADEAGKMNLNVRQAKGELLVVSQFTLYGDTAKGTRPSFSAAAERDKAELLYEYFVALCGHEYGSVNTGKFQAHMEVSLINDGPVTLLCEA